MMKPIDEVALLALRANRFTGNLDPTEDASVLERAFAGETTPDDRAATFTLGARVPVIPVEVGPHEAGGDRTDPVRYELGASGSR